MENLVNKINAHVAHYDEIVSVRRLEIELSACESNNNIAPNYDRTGRPHAPVDGYIVNEKSYGKGEFIPLYKNLDDIHYISDYTNHCHKIRIVGKKEDADIINKATGVTCSAGTTWSNGNCYLYIKCVTKGIKNIIREYQSDIIAEEKARKEALLAEKKAAKGDVPTGKIEVKGKVVSYKLQENHFAYNAPCVPKIVVELDNGATVFGTLPTKLDDQYGRDIVGKILRFCATVEASKDDNSHGYYKRPTKPMVEGA